MIQIQIFILNIESNLSGRLFYGLVQIDHPQQQSKNVYRSVVSIQRKRAVIACFRHLPLHSLTRSIFSYDLFFVEM